MSAHRLLSIDGGGARGVVALEVLSRLESELRLATGEPDLVLGDWFDYIGGTSTGAIIATGLALGMPVARLQALYADHAQDIFTRAGFRDRLHHRYDEEGLADLLRREYGADRTLGSPDLRCLLLLGLRNATTGSPWPLSNNPAAEFNQGPASNLELPLWQLVRASTAAPTYFPAERIELGGGLSHLFSDGAITTLNNPGLQLVLMATLPAYRLTWPTGADQLLLVSVGTGSTARRADRLGLRDLTLLHEARAVPESLIHSVVTQQDLVCRVLGECRHGPPIDAELGDLVGGAGLVREPLFRYLRYDAEATPASLAGLGVGHLQPADLVGLDDIEHLDEMREFGRAIAGQVDLAHLDGFLG